MPGHPFEASLTHPMHHGVRPSADSRSVRDKSSSHVPGIAYPAERNSGTGYQIKLFTERLPNTAYMPPSLDGHEPSDPTVPSETR